MFKDILEESSIIFNQEDIYYRFNEWKRLRGKNILLVTGLSGSGKTTLSEELARKYNAKILYLDAFDNMDLEFDYTGVIKKFYDSKRIDYKDNKAIWEREDINYEELIVEFFKFAVNKLSDNPKELYIIEGIQIYVYVPPTILEDFPIVIKGTSYISSQYRRIARNGNFVKYLLHELKHYGLRRMKLYYHDHKTLKTLEHHLQNKKKGIGGMFGDLLREASMPNEYYLPGENGKIQAFEDAFGDDEIKKAIAYGFSSSHEYDNPEKKIFAVKSCIKFVNNYNWEKKDFDVNKIESFNKPLNMKKVYNIAKSIEEEGNIEPLIVVNKIHGFNWQSKGKVILTDGNHRLGAIKVLELQKTPVYYGTYTGNSERPHEEFIPSNEETKDINESTVEEDIQLSLSENYIPDKLFSSTSNIKNFFIESSDEYKLLRKSTLNKMEPLFDASIEKVYLTPSEQEAVKQKYGEVECSFAKNKKNGKYFCYTHRARSKFYDSPTDIPKDVVEFISSTS